MTRGTNLFLNMTSYVYNNLLVQSIAKHLTHTVSHSYLYTMHFSMHLVTSLHTPLPTTASHAFLYVAQTVETCSSTYMTSKTV